MEVIDGCQKWLLIEEPLQHSSSCSEKQVPPNKTANVVIVATDLQAVSGPSVIWI